MRCDHCFDDEPPREATRVWYRTAAEIKRGKGRILPVFYACERHAVPWRPWVAVGTPAPAETKAKRAPKMCPHCGGKVS